MSLIDQIIQSEINFPRSFANVEKRPYGLLYHNIEIPDSHDSNHAWILQGQQLKSAVADMEAFYHRQGLVPRIYHLSPLGRGEYLRRALVAASFVVQDHSSQFFVLGRQSEIQPSDEIVVRRVQSPLPELLAMMEQSDSPRAMKVVRRRLQSPDYHLLVGFLQGHPVTMGSLGTTGACSRVDDILTHVPYRRRGYARTLVHQLVQYHTQILGNMLCLYTDNPTAARIYQEAGFDKLNVEIDSWSAWREQ